MNRVLVIDKPAGPTSHDVVDRVRRSTGSRRVGHAGSLDPAATGVLVVLVGKATRLSQFLMDEEKEYRGTIVLGVCTDTQDAEGRVISTCEVGAVSEDEIASAFEGFRGDIEQTPPMVSAIKREGTPLYVLARRGVVVEREPRRVTIKSLRVLSVELPLIRFEAVCSKGTYVRTLAADIGERLGTGGHLGELRRTRVGHFTLDESLPLEQLEKLGESIDDVGTSMFDALPSLGVLRVTRDEAEAISTGGAIDVEARRIDGEPLGHVRLTADGLNLLAVASITPREGAEGYDSVRVQPVRVFVEPE